MNYENLVLVIESTLRITDQDTEQLIPYVLKDDQHKILKAIVDNDRLIVLKGRQIGSSTVCCAYVAIYLCINPGSSVAVLANNDNQSKYLARKISTFLNQLGVGLSRDNAKELILSNGSELHVITANSPSGSESTAGRGKTFSLVYASEAAFYENSEAVWASITSSVTKNAKIVLESTARPSSGIFKKLWDGKQYTQVFCSVEDHEGYQLEPDTLSDQEWEALQEENDFTRRDSAAWWSHKLNTEFIGDRTRMLREYPVRQDQAWTVAGGRWITTQSIVYPHVILQPRNSAPGAIGPLFNAAGTPVYIPTGIWSGYIKQFNPPVVTNKYIMAIDPAGGNGGDDSVIIVYNLNTKKIDASWSNNNTPLDLQLEAIMYLDSIYRPEHIYVEKTGLGKGLVDFGRKKNKLIVALDTGEKSKYQGLLLVKNWVEKGGGAGEDFLKNVESCSLSYKPKSGKEEFTGKKDMLMCMGFILLREDLYKRLVNPAPPDFVDQRLFKMERLYRKQPTEIGFPKFN